MGICQIVQSGSQRSERLRAFRLGKEVSSWGGFPAYGKLSGQGVDAIISLDAISVKRSLFHEAVKQEIHRGP
jgi:hypothetical protein